MSRLLKTFIDVRPGERTLTLLMLTQQFLILVAFYFLKPARDSLFLSTVGPTQLPFVFILVAIVAIPVTTFFSRISRARPLHELTSFTILAMIGSLLVMRLLIEVDSGWVYYLFYVWVSVIGILAGSQFWLMANVLYDATQAKRLFALLGLGGILGAFVGGGLTAVLVERVGFTTENLLMLAAVLFAVRWIVVRHIWKRFEPIVDGRGGRDGEEVRNRERFGTILKTVSRSRYLMVIVGIIAIATVTATFIDYQFKTVAAGQFADRDGLTTFFGEFYAVLSLISFLVQLFISTRLIRKFGVGAAVLIMPMILLFGAAAIFVLPLFTAMLVLAGGQGSLEHSLDRTARELLFLPLPLEVKRRAKLFVDLFVDRWFRGVSGLLLLLFTMVLGFTVVGLGVVVLVLVAMWLCLAWMARAEYVNAFRRALERRELDLGRLEVDVTESATVKALLGSIETGNERQIIYALELFMTVRDVRVADRIQPLLAHASAAVRSRALQVMALQDDRPDREQVEVLLEDPDQDVRREAVRLSLSVNDEDDSVLYLRELAEDERTLRRLAALDFIATYGTEQMLSLVDQSTLEGLLAPEAEYPLLSRRLASRLLSRADIPGKDRYLDILLQDPELEVRKEAVRAIGEGGRLEFLTRLIDLLADTQLRATAREALVALGRPILGSLRDRLLDEELLMSVRRQIARVLSRIPNQEAVDILLSALERVNPGLRFDVIKALNQLHVTNPRLRLSDQRLTAAVLHETRRYARILGVLQQSLTTPEVAACRLLRRALTEALDHNLERIFRLLGLVYPSRDIHNAYHGLVSESRSQRASAIEFLDSVLDQQIKQALFPVLDDIASGAITRRTAEVLKKPIRDRAEALRWLALGADPWLRACAIYAARHIMPDQLSEEIHRAAHDRDPMVREAATVPVNPV